MADKQVKYHSTLSRRDFMKALGLGGIGLGMAGLAPAIAPAGFKDLDEVLASPEGELKRPSWVREVDKPTVDLDWDIIKPFDYREVMFVKGFVKSVGEEYARWAGQAGTANTKLWINQGRPGFTLRDYAVNASCRAYAFDSHSFLGYRRSPTPDMLGVPRWEGTAEENSRMVRSVMRLYGADEIAFVELDENTEKLIYTHDTDGKEIRIEHVSEPQDEEGYKIIPKKARWVIVYTVKMSYELVRRLPSWSAGSTVYHAYSFGPYLQDRFQDFVRTLGYTCLGECSPNALGTATGFGAMGGLGEVSRVEHLVTPNRGLSHRVFKMITDLPLVATRPIDTGVHEFCKTCKKCAETCPAEAIPSSTEPTWDIPGPFKRPGVKGWFRAEPRCYSYWRQTSTGCGFCLAVCPLNRPQSASYFSTMRSIISKTSAMNRTFRKMDDMLGWGARQDYESFWDLEMPTLGWD
ncbi:MAG: reductive dehalogenase [Dehalococcoidaceae bacterium]|nr:reductive dehalogenase [Dehalococcoidaceae bacterium]